MVLTTDGSIKKVSLSASHKKELAPNNTVVIANKAPNILSGNAVNYINDNDSCEVTLTLADTKKYTSAKHDKKEYGFVIKDNQNGVNLIAFNSTKATNQSSKTTETATPYNPPIDLSSFLVKAGVPPDLVEPIVQNGITHTEAARLASILYKKQNPLKTYGPMAIAPHLFKEIGLAKQKASSSELVEKLQAYRDFAVPYVDGSLRNAFSGLALQYAGDIELDTHRKSFKLGPFISGKFYPFSIESNTYKFYILNPNGSYGKCIRELSIEKPKFLAVPKKYIVPPGDHIAKLSPTEDPLRGEFPFTDTPIYALKNIAIINEYFPSNVFASQKVSKMLDFKRKESQLFSEMHQHNIASKAYNAHSLIFHKLQGDPTDPGNYASYIMGLPYWDNIVADDIIERINLGDLAPVLAKDKICLYDCFVQYIIIDGNYFTATSGLVVEVDSQGKALSIISKIGDNLLYAYHPSADNLSILLAKFVNNTLATNKNYKIANKKLITSDGKEHTIDISYQFYRYKNHVTLNKYIDLELFESLKSKIPSSGSRP
ncbi:MAG: hypothetical protein JW841_01920 [Deltaproteobacteria bacterium]|nr:hypothetical protein [Deltaproteobacteria bacterium]